MLKKVITVAVSVCLMCNIGVLAEETPASSETAPATSTERPMRGNFDPSQIPQGNFDPSQMPQGNFDPSQIPQGGFPSRTGKNDVNKLENTVPVEEGKGVNEQTSQNNDENAQREQRQSPFGEGFSGNMGGLPGNMQNSEINIDSTQQTGFLGFIKTYETPITALALLGAAYLFVLLYKRKHY